MTINLGAADAGVAISIKVLDDYLKELHRIGRIPQNFNFVRTVNGNDLDIVVLLEPPNFEMAKPVNEEPYTRMVLTGTLEIRPVDQPMDPPIELPLNAAARIGLILIPGADDILEIGLDYEGSDSTPSPPVTEQDIDEIFNSPEIANILNSTRLPLAASLIEGLNASRFPIEALRPANSDWNVSLNLMPAGVDTVDSFAITVAPPGVLATPELIESFVIPLTGLSVVYNRSFLDLMLERGANFNVGQKISGANVISLNLQMNDNDIAVSGHVVRPVDSPGIDVLPDVDIRFNGPAIPSLVRGTTTMAFNTDGIEVDIDDADEIFYSALKWITTIGAGALLFTGWASLTLIGIALWLTAVQKVWKGDADLQNAPNLLRDSLGTALGVQLSALADALDEDNDVGELRIDATPDSLRVVEGNMVFYAQILVIPIVAMMQKGEYSKSLRRFVIFELNDGRKFRAQELARLMKAGKITVPGYHQVGGNFIRANPDNKKANNLLKEFKANITNEVVVKSKRN